jgi:hypothetical protein
MSIDRCSQTRQNFRFYAKIHRTISNYHNKHLFRYHRSQCYRAISNSRVRRHHAGAVAVGSKSRLRPTKALVKASIGFYCPKRQLLITVTGAWQLPVIAGQDEGSLVYIYLRN